MSTNNGNNSNNGTNLFQSFWKSKGKTPGSIKSVSSFESIKILRDIGKISNPESPVSEIESQKSNSTSPISTPSQTNPQGSLFNRKSSDSIKIGESSRVKKFQQLLDADNVVLEELKKLSWQGIPKEYRSLVWKLLLEYVPANKDRRETAIERKRKEYFDFVTKYYYIDESERTPDEKTLYHQVKIDCPRTNPSIPLFQSEIIQEFLGKVLYIWAIRHPASGYVQGINDLATPFLVVFLSDYVEDPEGCAVSQIDPEILKNIEADTYWCLTKLLDGIQDHYTFAQPGIQRMVHKLGEIVRRLDEPLFEHFKKENVQFLQFAFRWMNCLLMREIRMILIVRTWDTYFSDLETFSTLHIYVCAAFLLKFSDTLKQKDWQEMMLFLKAPPTNSWGTQDIEILLSQAYIWSAMFENSPKHLEQK